MDSLTGICRCVPMLRDLRMQWSLQLCRTCGPCGMVTASKRAARKIRVGIYPSQDWANINVYLWGHGCMFGWLRGAFLASRLNPLSLIFSFLPVHSLRQCCLLQSVSFAGLASRFAFAGVGGASRFSFVGGGTALRFFFVGVGGASRFS